MDTKTVVRETVNDTLRRQDHLQQKPPPPTGHGSLEDIAKFSALRVPGYASDPGNNLRAGLTSKYLYRDFQERGPAKTSVVDDFAALPPAITRALSSPAPAPSANRNSTPERPNFSFDDLRSVPENVVWRKGNSYFGRNVEANAPMRDAVTGNVVTPRGTVSTLDESARREYYANVLRGSGGGGGSDTTRRDFSLDLQGLLKQLERQPGEPSYRYRARTAAINEAVQNYVNLENNRRIVGATLRGQDMELQGRLLPKQLELEQARQLRALQGEFFRAAGGDARKAAALAASAGMPELAKSFYDLAEGSQKYSQGANKTALESLKSHATPDEKGNITEAEEARLRRRVESAVPGYLNMSENERLAYQPEADGTLSLIKGINARRNHRLSQAIGLDAPDPEFDRLPDLRGGKLGEVGFFEGLFTPQVQRGDYYVELPNDQKIYIGRDSLTENARELLKKRSVSTSALRD